MPLAALVTVAVGVPLVACGGRVTDSGDEDSGSSSEEPTGSGATSSAPTAAGTTGTTAPTSTAAPTGSTTATSAPTSPTGSASPIDIRTVPCTAYTAAYNTCSPSTGSTAGCMYYANLPSNPQGVDPDPSARVAPGCQLEIVPPTAPSGASCDHVGCTCTSEGWQTDADSGDGFLCPTGN